jgi:phenylpropionate dioxygenase-like ring-hydroxylating dioxygenase large terminal subunit
LCPFHGWSFDLDGTRSNIPHWEDDFLHVTPHSCRLVEYPVDYFEGFLFVKLGGSSPPPSETMAGFRELVSHYDIPRMEMSYEPEDQDYQANWKLIYRAYPKTRNFSCVTTLKLSDT